MATEVLSANVDFLRYDAAAFEASDYAPGVCNIGPAEIEARRRGGYAAAAAGGLLFGALVALRAPRPSRLLVALPAAAAAGGFLQAHFHFCAGFGARGVYNFGELGDEEQVLDPAYAAADRAKSARIAAASAAIGLAAGLAATLVPIG